MSTSPAETPSTGLTPVATPTPTQSSPPSAKRPSKRAVVVMTTVAVALIVALAALLSGWIPGLAGSGKSSTCCPPTSSERSAATLGGAYVNGLPGGPWTFVGADGVVSLEGMTVNGSGWGTTTCPLTEGSATVVDVAGDNGTYYSGNAEGWYLFYNSPGTGRGAELFLFVRGGTVYDFGELVGGGGCGTILPEAALSSNLIDSTTAASAAIETAAGAAYIAANPHANATYSLAGSTAYPPAFWLIYFDACTGGISASFTAGIYATNGTVISTTNQPGSSCGG